MRSSAPSAPRAFRNARKRTSRSWSGRVSSASAWRDSTPLAPSHHRISRRRLAKPGGAELWRALLRLEVDMDETEAARIAVRPFEIVHRAPHEVALHRNAFGGRTLKLGHGV